VFKLIVSAAALSTGKYTPQTKIPAPNRLLLPQSTKQLENFNGESCNGGADQSLLDALTISCNTAFAQLGITLGEDKIRAMAEAFGIGKSVDLPLHVSPSTIGSIDDAAQLGVSSIGQQDVQFTPMQGAMIAAAIANQGLLMKPYLVDSIQAPDLTVVDKLSPAEMGRAISPEVATALTQMMTSVVDRGTGRKARIQGVQVAGKTGTAQNSATDHAWFVGFAPADHPKIAVAVFIKNGGATGGDISAPVARQVIQAYLSGHGG
jgi:peptidoglycan glycosyltransferase